MPCSLRGDRLKELQDAKAIAAKALQDGIEADVDDEKFGELSAAVEQADKAIKRYEDRLATVEDVRGSFTTSDEPQIGQIRDAWRDDPKCGYKQPRDFLMEVMDCSRTGQTTPQLKFLSAAGSDEHSTINDTYGGFLVPEGFRPEVLSVPVEEDPTAGLVTSIPMETDVVNIPARTDKNHSTSVSGGLTVGRTTETQSPSSSRMAMENVKLEATALMGLSYASEQLLERSAVSFAALLERGFADEFRSTMLNEKINGVGAGNPVGVINAACTVSVAKEGSQSADTILGANLLKMKERAWRFGRSIWLANHDTERQLIGAHTTLTNDDRPLFSYGNGTDRPDTLLGRPIFFTEYCPTLGDVGDIILADWSQYLWGTLGSTTPQQAESMHVRFVNHERTFKFYMYNTGSPWWKSALTPKNGANTLSPFVVLAERA